MTFDTVDTAPVNDVDDLCAGGYMHGILEEAFVHDKDLQKDPGKICRPIPASNQ